MNVHFAFGTSLSACLLQRLVCRLGGDAKTAPIGAATAQKCPNSADWRGRFQSFFPRFFSGRAPRNFSRFFRGSHVKTKDFQKVFRRCSEAWETRWGGFRRFSEDFFSSFVFSRGGRSGATFFKNGAATRQHHIFFWRC